MRYSAHTTANAAQQAHFLDEKVPQVFGRVHEAQRLDFAAHSIAELLLILLEQADSLSCSCAARAPMEVLAHKGLAAQGCRGQPRSQWTAGR